MFAKLDLPEPEPPNVLDDPAADAIRALVASIDVVLTGVPV